MLSSKDKWRGLLTHFSLLTWQVEYACDQDYELTGDTERTCEADGAWSGEDPVCTAITCEPPPNIDNGRYSYKDLKVWERERERESEREVGRGRERERERERERIHARLRSILHE